MQNFQLHPALSVKRVGTTLKIGVFPPHASEIDDADGSIEKVLVDPTDATREICESLVEAGLFFPPVDKGDRFSRHDLYFQLAGIEGSKGSERLREKTVCLIGAGGIGSTTALILSASGVGRLKIADADHIEETNLTRCILFSEENVGIPKVDVCRHKLFKRSSFLKIETKKRQLEQSTCAEYLDFIRGADVVILSGDSHPSVFIYVHTLCKALGIPFLPAGYIEHNGAVGPFLFPEDEKYFLNELVTERGKTTFAKEINPNYQAASYGPLNCLVSSIAANEVIRFLLGLPLSTRKRTLIINSFTYETEFQNFAE